MTNLRTPRRYQLRKEAVGVVTRDLPWIFRDHLSTAAAVFDDGQWLRLYDGHNKILGHGIFEAEGAVAIRVLRRGTAAPDAAWVRAKVEAAIARRAKLAGTTNAYRVVHGESDGLAAVVIDKFGEVLVVQSYSAGADGLARYAALLAAQALGVPHVIVRPAHRRRAGDEAPRAAYTLKGKPPALAAFAEGQGIAGVAPRRFEVDVLTGQKSGAFLDLRGLRRNLAERNLQGARVLNLYAYTGMLGRAVEQAGAAEIWQVDASEAALAFAAAHHVTEAGRHRFITADVFEWLPALDPAEQFDVVVVDPPSMTSRVAQVPGVLASYRRLYRAALRHVKPGGLLVAACCTARVTRDAFTRTVKGALGPEFSHERDLPVEADHPVGFPQADYLKIGLYRRAAAPTT
jgi:23S rRNA (cytosine1962-C5)-methyltransferase